MRIRGLAELVARVESLRAASSAPRLLVGIAGPPGAGKTTLARALVRELAGADDWRGTRVAHVPMDGFHLADRELERLARRDRKGAPDTFDTAGYAALLRRVRDGETVWAPDFERDLEQPIAQGLPVVADARIVISEGNYLLLPEDGWPQVRELFDEVWFCRADPAVRRAKLVERHVRFGKEPEAARTWVAHTDDPNAALVTPTEAAADLVVDCDLGT
ncbi:Panthothenate kinase [Jatrophihabitans endophyticus]|uniref:Panthothenate kinase n=1 Tax=Jatrophihabitans endophyticus TaxID=1206085 RepID=A0A1M5RBT3_9ACTN|nr:nucleoside/nucleotide kinase family protein [Jatrophihabitans endophyticus]SHH23721.1 Panthothenate kinase [Jatrophihabitans endophyticus]